MMSWEFTYIKCILNHTTRHNSSQLKLLLDLMCHHLKYQSTAFTSPALFTVALINNHILLYLFFLLTPICCPLLVIANLKPAFCVLELAPTNTL